MWLAYGSLLNRLDKEFGARKFEYALFIDDDNPGPDSKCLVFSYLSHEKQDFIRMEFPVSMLIKNESAIFDQIRMRMMFS
jgi:hypothetical protein